MAFKEKLENLSAILKPVALVVEIVAFGLIVWQVSISRQAFEAQAWQGISQQMAEIDKLFIEQPDLYPYFYQKKKIQPNDKIYPKVMANV